MTDWTDSLVGARMQVDNRFQDRVESSDFSNQEWGLIMTAIEFEVEQPDDADRARMVADHSNLDQVVPELGRIQKQMGGSPTAVADGPDRSGIMGQLRTLMDSLTGDRNSGSDEARMADAEELTQGYAHELQTFLEENDRWDEVREQASAESDSEE